MGTAFVLKLAVGLLTFLLAVATIAWIRPQDSITIGLVMIVAGGVLFQAFDTIDFWFQSQVQSKYTVYARDAAFLLVTGVKIVLILEQAPLIAFAWAMLAEVVVGAIGLVAVYWGTGHLLKEWQVSIQRAKMLLSDSWPLILSGLVIVVYMRIDQVMLGEMKGAEAVGIYSAAVKLSEVWYFIPMAIVSSVFPSIIEAKKLSEKLYYDRITIIQSHVRACLYCCNSDDGFVGLVGSHSLWSGVRRGRPCTRYPYMGFAICVLRSGKESMDYERRLDEIHLCLDRNRCDCQCCFELPTYTAVWDDRSSSCYAHSADGSCVRIECLLWKDESDICNTDTSDLYV